MAHVEVGMVNGGVDVSEDVEEFGLSAVFNEEAQGVGGGVARGVPYAERESVVAIAEVAHGIGYGA